MAKRVVCVGEVVVDLTHTDKCLQLAIGGAPLNVATGLRRMGINPYFITAIGDDWFGEMVASFIRREGVVGEIKVIKGVPTRLSIVSKDVHGERSFSFIPGTAADDYISKCNFSKRWLEGVAAVYYGTFPFYAGSIPDRFVNFLKGAKKKGALLFFDPNLRLDRFKTVHQARKVVRDLIQHADVLKLNFDELRFLLHREYLKFPPSKSMVASLFSSGLQTLIVTNGKFGSLVLSKSDMVYVPAVMVKSVDTTACGDAFMAAIIAELLDKSESQKSWQKILSFANAAGALCSIKQGSAESIPTYEEVMVFLDVKRK